MKLTIEPTTQTTTLIIAGAEVPARVWEGTDEHGVQVHCYITRVAVHQDEPEAVHERFGRELVEQARARLPSINLPLRLIL